MAERGLPIPPSSQPGSEGKAPTVAGRAAAGKDPAAGRISAWTGVYTDAQAARGQAAYRQSCAHCHSEDLLGERSAPALVGQPFSARWVNLPVSEMLQVIRATMPQEAPDTLGAEMYVDIISYMLKMNGATPGTSELPSDAPALERIVVTSRP
jgi:mono/diheme cytochrome c family protein